MPWPKAARAGGSVAAGTSLGVRLPAPLALCLDSGCAQIQFTRIA